MGALRYGKRGFSLVKTGAVAAIVLAGAIGAYSWFTGGAEKSSPKNRPNSAESTRLFIQQMAVELNKAGHPDNDRRAPAGAAAGLLYASPTEVRFTADLDGSGKMQVVVYQIGSQKASECPCSLWRGHAALSAGRRLESQPLPLMASAIGNITNPSGEPFFRFYDREGNEITSLPLTYHTGRKDGGPISAIARVDIAATVPAADGAGAAAPRRPDAIFTGTAQVR